MAPTFRQVGGANELAVASGDRVLITRTTNTTLGAGGTVVNDRSGSKTNITIPTGCYNEAFGGPYLLYACPPPPSMPQSQPFVLDDVVSGTTRPVTLSSGSPVAIGTHWLQLTRAVEENEHSPHVTTYLNLDSGAVRADPVRSGGRVIADLNAPSLTRRACAPAHVPRSYDPIAAQVTAGQLIALDKVVLSIGAHVGSRDKDFGSPWVRLVRCGSGASRTIDAYPGAIAVDPRLVLWQQDKNHLAGYVLPSERPLRVTLPRRLAYNGISLALSTRNLYITAAGRVGATPLARLLKEGAASCCLVARSRSLPTGSLNHRNDGFRTNTARRKRRRSPPAMSPPTQA